uniref:Peptidase S1 domain-containing protein n=1 Tax=Varanus komodoensis TaxID=61221 RepID=A0A8D2J1S1_VARKO
TELASQPPSITRLRHHGKTLPVKTLILLALQTILINPPISSPSYIACGQPINPPRIVGGQSAKPGSWPWQVSISNNKQHFCGGSLISDQWILSAAHCFYDANIFNTYEVLLGANQLFNPSSNAAAPPLKKIVLYPAYNPDTNSGDVALLQLKAPVKFTEYIRPVCLPNSSVQFTPNADCWVTGWGNINSNVNLPFPSVLQQVKVPLISQKACNTLYNNVTTSHIGKDLIKDDMICAGFPEGGKDSCQGDSGGPLVCNLPEGWTQAGIVSWGIGCAQASRPGVYTLATWKLSLGENANDFSSNHGLCSGA